MQLGANTARVASFLVAFGFLTTALFAQTRLGLLEATSRKPPDYSAVYLDREVAVRGVVNQAPLRIPGYTQLAIEDGRAGAVLQVGPGDTRLDGFQPGAELEVTGEVKQNSGLVVIQPSSIKQVGSVQPPSPLDVALPDLIGFSNLGRAVRTEGQVKEIGENAGGAFVVIAESGASVRIFIPRSPNRLPVDLGAMFNAGDKVQVTGIAYQYCPHPPYNRQYEVLANSASNLLRTQRTWFITPPIVITGLSLFVIVVFGLWARERRLRKQRETLRKTYQLGEEILSSNGTEAILRRIKESLPAVLGVTGIHLYVHNRSSRSLDEVAADKSEATSIPLSPPPDNAKSGAAACFDYRTLIVIPDSERSPFPVAARDGGRPPKSLLFVPMVAQGEVIGVLELDQDDRARAFRPEEQALAQHLGNQIGVAIRLLDQRLVREQLFRTEKLAAVGRLITGVVNELQTPLASISDLAAKAMEKSWGNAEREVSAIAAEAQKASAMVARLVSFAATEQGEARLVAITSLLRSLVEFREGDWKASGIRVRDLITREAILVLGSHGQLEQVFLNLFIYAEQALAAAQQKTITIRTSLLARWVLVEISFSAPAEMRNPEEIASVLGVARSVVAGHGGEVRLIEKNNEEPRFEVELPVSAKERSATVAATHNGKQEYTPHMTALIIDSEESAQRHMMGLLAVRGYRAVPVSNADAGLDLAHRMRFDVAFCSVHAPGLNWVELSERMHTRMAGFVLLSDGYDAELSANFEGDGKFVLAKPVQEEELDRVLRAIEPRTVVNAD